MIWSKKFWQTKDQIHRSLKRDSVRNELESSLRRLKIGRHRSLPDPLARSRR